MRFKSSVFYIFFIILECNLHYLNGNNLASSFSPLNLPATVLPQQTTTPEDLQHEATTPQELENASKLTDAFSKMLEVFDSPAPITKDLKKLLEASKTVGLLLYAFNKTNAEKFPVTDDLKIARKRLIMKLDYGTPDYYVVDVNRVLVNDEYRRIVLLSVESVKDIMIDILENLDKAKIYLFKTRCSKAEETLEEMETKLGSLLNESVIMKDYSYKYYNYLYSKYHKSLKQVLAAYPMCEVLKNGPPNATTTLARGKMIIQLLQSIEKQFQAVNSERQDLYWTSDTLKNITQNYIDDEFITEKLAANLYDELAEMYKYSDYNIHLVVNSNVDPYHYGAILHCPTECKSIENYMNKNVYIMRNVKTNKGYHQCDYLLSLQTAAETKFTCDNKNSGKLKLEPLVNEIVANCKNLRGISIVRDGFGYASKGDKSDKGFTEIFFEHKCFGKVYVVVSNDPM